MFDSDDLGQAMVKQKTRAPSVSITGLSSLFAKAKSKIDDVFLMRRVDKLINNGRKSLPK